MGLTVQPLGLSVTAFHLIRRVLFDGESHWSGAVWRVGVRQRGRYCDAVLG